MSNAKQTLLVDKSTPGHWRVTLDNPPINVIDDSMYDAFYDLVGGGSHEMMTQIQLGPEYTGTPLTVITAP